MVRKILRFMPLAALAFATQVDAQRRLDECLQCHRNSSSAVPVPRIEGQHAAYLARELARFRDAHREGFPMQIQAASLTSAEVDSLAAELAAQPWDPAPQRTDGKATATGGPLAAALACSTCHGPAYRGGGAVPRLAGQNPEYLARQLRAFDQGHRELSLPEAARSMKGLDEQETVALAAYLGSLNGQVDLHWLAGHWCGESGTRRSEEWWTDARAGLMLGLHRDVEAGKPPGFEFLRIEIGEGDAVYHAQPQGKPAVPFRLVEMGATHAVFANPAHDYPRRLRYQRHGNALKATVDDGLGGEVLQLDWTLDCR